MKIILYVVSTLGSSGPTNQLFSVIKHLNRDEFMPFIVTLSPEPENTRWGDFENLGLNIYNLDLSTIHGVFASKSMLQSYVEKINPDLVHSQGIRSDYLVSQMNVKKVCTAHCFLGTDYRMSYGRLSGRLMSFVHTKAMLKFDICVGVSEAVSAYLSDSLHVYNVRTIRNGIETDLFFPPLVDEKIRLREKLGLPLNGNIWITTGHLSEIKNQLFIIKMWKNRLIGSDNHLVLLGDGNQRSDCEKEAYGVENIHIVGSVKNVRDYLAASDYYISASKAEGLPLSVIEAASCGLPVLLSNIQPHKELFNTKAEIGELFEEDSEDSFSKGMNALLSSIYEDISNNILQMVREHFCASQMSENYQKIYKTIIGQAE